MRALPVLLTLAALGGGATAAAAQGDPVPLTAELPLHAGEGCWQFRLDVTALSDGGFAATWHENVDKLYFRRFDALGSPAGPPVLVGRGALGSPTVLAGPGGTVRVVWSDGDSLWTRAFGASGAPLSPEPTLLGPAPGYLESAVTAFGDGGFAIVTAADELVLRRYTADGQLAGTEVLVPGGPGLGESFFAPDVAPHGRSGVVVVWSDFRDNGIFFEGRILDFAGTSTPFETGPIHFRGADEEGEPARPRVASGAAGTVMVSWREETVFESRIVARVFGADGVPLGEAFPVDPSRLAIGFAPELASDGAGNFLVSWLGVEEIYLRRVSPRGVPLGTTQVVATGTQRPELFWPPVLAMSSAGRLMVAWVPDGLEELARPRCYSQGLFARVYDASTGVLPLQGGRFRVSVRWTDHQGNTGEGKPVALTADSGYFWFFGPENLELMVKVLDGRPVNGRFWFSYAALSDVAYTITVTDTVTGIARDYTNPAGRLASHADTSTFVAPATTSAGLQQVFAAAAQPLSDTAAAGPCAAADQPRRPGLCLGGRFEVEVVWTAPSLGSGAGQGVPLTTDSGYLWFFGANNIELVVKVLDGRPVNGHFWVFFGSLTDVEHRLTVRDTVTGTERVYTNPAGQFHSRADTAAF